MNIEIVETALESDDEYARIPIAFEVTAVFDVHGESLSERAVEAPYVKNYDGPAQWRATFDVSKWGCLAAYADGHRAGGAVIAVDTPGVSMLRGRRDLAVLWDLRIAPEMRGQGLGTALFRAAGEWAIARGYLDLEVETQNTNVPACRFYARQGCVLRGVHPNAYPEHLDEVQLLWFKDLRVSFSAR